MAEQRVSLTKKQLATPKGAELLKLCRAIKGDGLLSKDDIIALANWLAANRQCGLPSVEYLHSIVKQVVADKRVSADEMKELHAAIEKVLPSDARKDAAESRKSIERAVRAKRKEIAKAERDAQRQAEKLRKEQERERRQLERATRPRGFHSKVYGVTQQNPDGSDRQALIRDYVRPGMELTMKREPDNPHDECAISLWIKTRSFGFFESERQIGFVNADVAENLAPHLDEGGWARVTVANVTGGGDLHYGVNIFIENDRKEWYR